MRKLTEEEFNDRMLAIQRAQRIFVDSGLTNNITIAFQLYQEVFAEREREIFLSANIYGVNIKPMDKYERPKCPDCNSDMMFRIIPPNTDNILTQLVCSGCDLVLDSDKSIDDWMKVLVIKDV